MKKKRVIYFIKLLVDEKESKIAALANEIKILHEIKLSDNLVTFYDVL